jgi:hypothetical protein
MGIRNLHYLIEEQGGFMHDEERPNKDEHDSPPVSPEREDRPPDSQPQSTQFPSPDENVHDEPVTEPPEDPAPAEEQGGDAASLPDDQAEQTIPEPRTSEGAEKLPPMEGGSGEDENPPKPVDDPNLPEEGDPEDFDEEEVGEDDFTDDTEAAADKTMDTGEEAEEPNDLSDVDKEFDDDED